MGIMKFNSFILFVSLVVATNISVAQTAKDTIEIVEIGKQKFYIHTVEAGHTLYAISKKYNTPIDVIKDANPGIENGLSIGQKIKIPVKKDSKEAVNSEAIKLDGNYILHEVQPGETAYGIAKSYNISFKELAIENANLDSLSIGQHLKIPVAKIKQEKPANLTEAQHSNYIQHIVMKGQTLYSLSKQYNTTVDSIVQVNDGLPKGLVEGETILIPKKKAVKIDKNDNRLTQELKNALTQSFSVKDSLEQDTIIKKEKYKIALLLPFYGDVNRNLEANRNAIDKKQVYAKSIIGLDIYQGVLFALDSLKRMGVNTDLYVFDTGNDSLQIASILAKQELKQMDLILGPLYFSGFETVAAFAKANEIPIVSPVPLNNKILLGNSFVSKIISSDIIQIEELSKYLVDSMKQYNIVIVKQNKEYDKKWAQTFMQTYRKLIKQTPDSNLYSLPKETTWTGSTSVRNNMISGKRNVLIVPSSDKAFVADFMNKMNNETKNYDITIFGDEKWQYYDNIDVAHIENMKLHLCVSNYFEDTLGNFTKEFIAYTETYPTKYASIGFDMALYFGGLLHNYGVNFMSWIEQEKLESTSVKFNFFKTGLESGYENRCAYILKFKNGNFHRMR